MARTAWSRNTIALVIATAVAISTPFAAAPAAMAAETPSFTAGVTEIPDERIDIAIEGTGYGDVKALPGQDGPHAYFTLIEKGSDLADVGQTDTAVSAAITTDGTVSHVLSVPAAEIDATTDYEIISWPSRSFPTAENLYARSDITIDWAVLLPEPIPDDSEEEPGGSEEDPADPDENLEDPGPGLTSPAFTTGVTEVPDTRIDIAIEGTGYGDVKALPGQDGPHAYFTLIEKGSDLAAVEDTQAAISANIDADGRVSDTLPIPAADLDATTEYEVISWPSRSFPTDQNLYARADIIVDWDALFPSGAPDRAVVTLSADSASAYADQAITLTATVTPDVEGTVTFRNGADPLGAAVQTVDGTATLRTSLPVGDHRITAHFAPDDEEYADSSSDPVSITVTERSAEGVLQWGVKSNFRSYVTGNIANGRITASEGAQQTAGNGVFTFPQASSGTDWNGQTGTVQYAGQVTFYGHSGALNHTVANPSIRVTSASSADLWIDYHGSSITFATIDLSTAVKQELDGEAVRFSSASATLTNAGAQFFSYQGHEFYSPGEALDRITFTIGEPSDIDTSEPPTTPPENVPSDPQQPETPASTQGTASAGSLTWGVSNAFVAYTTCAGIERFGYSHCAKGSISTSGVGDGYLFPQAEGGDWNAQTQTGTVNYSGVVSFLGYGMTMFSVSNPSITVSGPSSATLHTGNTASFGSTSYPLDLSSATTSVGGNGEVTWSGVGVRGSLTGGPGAGSQNSITFNDLSFTVGTPSGQTFGATSAGDSENGYEAATTPPTTEGLEVLTPADRIREGGRIQVQASGFDPDDSGVLVVLYPTGASSVPIVLDDGASADENGQVRWSGTLPNDGTGDHILTLQGSADAGAEIDILEKEAASATTVSALSEDGSLATAALIPLPTSGMALWEWWLIALSLVSIAGCTSVLAIRQQRTRMPLLPPNQKDSL
ncbi:MAG: HtaA domain-containing protein [Microbacterium sp.]